VRGFSHQELADRIGTHRETVTRCLNELRERGMLEATRGCIRLLKRDDLRTLADSR
jgi:CRP-like cAMP-binding protein